MPALVSLTRAGVSKPTQRLDGVYGLLLSASIAAQHRPSGEEQAQGVVVGSHCSIRGVAYSMMGLHCPIVSLHCGLLLSASITARSTGHQVGARGEGQLWAHTVQL